MSEYFLMFLRDSQLVRSVVLRERFYGFHLRREVLCRAGMSRQEAILRVVTLLAVLEIVRAEVEGYEVHLFSVETLGLIDGILGAISLR